MTHNQSINDPGGDQTTPCTACGRPKPAWEKTDMHLACWLATVDVVAPVRRSDGAVR